MQAVNLLPADARVSNKGFTSVGSDLPAKKTLRIGGAVAAAFALLLAGLYVHERSVVNSKTSTLSSDQTRLAAVQAQVDAIRAALSDSKSRDAAVVSVVNTRMNWDRTMSSLARVLPVDVVLNNLQAAAPVASASAAVSSTTATTGSPGGADDHGSRSIACACRNGHGPARAPALALERGSRVVGATGRWDDDVLHQRRRE